MNSDRSEVVAALARRLVARSAAGAIFNAKTRWPCDHENMTGRERDLQPTDPVSEECFKLLAEVIEEEIGARVAVDGTRVGDPEWVHAAAVVAADAVLDCFLVRRRSEPRYRRT